MIAVPAYRDLQTDCVRRNRRPIVADNREHAVLLAQWMVPELNHELVQVTDAWTGESLWRKQ